MDLDDPESMTLVQLRQFIALARIGSFVKASQALHITQPALSRSIKALEDELGQRLFDRIGRRIELTAFGQLTLERSQLLLEDAESLKAQGHSPHQGGAGRLRIGLGSGPGILLTAPLLHHFATRFPTLRVEISRGPIDVLVQRLQDRALDALVVDIRSLKPSADLKVEQVVEVPGAFMCRKDHPLARARAVRLERLLQYPVASTPLSDELARILIERYGPQADPQRMVTLSSEEISYLVDVAHASDAVVLAIRAAGPQLAEIRMTPAFEATARFGLVTVARRSEMAFLPEVRAVMGQVFGAARGDSRARVKPSGARSRGGG